MVKYPRSRNVKRSKKKSRRTYRRSNLRRSYRRRNSRNIRRSSATKKKSRRTYRRRNLKGGAGWTDEELRVLAVVVKVLDADDAWRRKDGEPVDRSSRVARIAALWNKQKAYSERSEESVREAMARPAPTSPPDWSLSDTASLERGNPPA